MRAYAGLPAEIASEINPCDAWAILPETRKAKLGYEMQRRHTLAKLLGEGLDIRTGKKHRPDDVLAKRESFKNA